MVLKRQTERTRTAVVDLNPSFRHQKVYEDMAPCIVPSGTYWVSIPGVADRLMSPTEIFRLQGWSLSDHGIMLDDFATHSFSYKDLAHMAGNAFEKHAVTWWLLASFAHYPWPTSL